MERAKRPKRLPIVLTKNETDLVHGNSMVPELKNRDTVMIDTSRKEIPAGPIYAVGIEDTIMVKRIEKHPGKLVLISDNKDYEAIYLKNREMERVRINGKVVWISYFFNMCHHER